MQLNISDIAKQAIIGEGSVNAAIYRVKNTIERRAKEGKQSPKFELALVELKQLETLNVPDWQLIAASKN